MQSTLTINRELKKIRTAVLVFMVLLVLSGATAFPLKTGIKILISSKQVFPAFYVPWLEQVAGAIQNTPELLFYGTDWLAFGHIVIALFFIPVFFKPVQYKMNLEMAMVACAGVFPLAFICGALRGIPFFHQLVDCAFGFIGFWILRYAHKKIVKLKKPTEYAVAL